nr:hypothetical protein [Tanacetum cinerariifolium]
MTTSKFTKTYNLVAFLKKPTEYEGFEQIIDFLNVNPIKYALTINPTIYTSCIKQFWATAKVKAVNGEVQIQALVDKKNVVITETSVRSDLHLEDAEGTECLPTAKIFEQLTLMGAKTTAWNEFSSTMAFAIICLATNQKFNFSKYIFDHMVKNIEDGVKFLKFRRFVQVFLDSQVEGTLKHKEIYVTLSHTKKIFANMKRQGKDFSGKVTPLFETMMVQPKEDIGKELKIPTDSHHIPIVTQPSTSSQLEYKKKSKKSKKRITEVPQLSKSTHDVADEHVTTTSNDPLLSGEDRLKLSEGRNDQDIFDTSIFDDEEVVAKKEVSTADPVPTDGEVVTTVGVEVSAAAITSQISIKKAEDDSSKRAANKVEQEDAKRKRIEEENESVKLKRCLEIIPKHDDDVTIEALEIGSLKRRVKKLEKKASKKTHKLKRLYKIGSSTRVKSFKDAGLDDQEDASKQGRMIADLDANEGVALVDETQGRNDQDMFDTSIFDDEEVVPAKEVSIVDPVTTASKVVTIAGVEDSTAATTADVEVSVAAITSQISMDEITLTKALINIKTSKPKAKGIVIQDPNYELAVRLQEEEIGELSIEEKLFVELMDKRKKYFARLRAKKIRSKPPTKAQKRNQMCTYLKNMANYKHNQLKRKVKGNEKTAEDSEKAKEGSSKRVAEKLEQEDAKRQRIEEENESAELKRCLEIIPEDDDDNMVYYLLVEKMYPFTRNILNQMWNDVRLQ